MWYLDWKKIVLLNTLFKGRKWYCRLQGFTVCKGRAENPENAKVTANLTGKVFPWRASCMT
jgi:hypothetical protein